MDIAHMSADCIGQEEVLLFIEQAKDIDNPQFVNLDLTLAQLKAIVEVGEDYRQDLFASRVVGISKFSPGDVVRDTLSGKEFEITTGHTGPHPDPEVKKHVWWYKRGFYFISEIDLELVKPRSKCDKRNWNVCH